MTEGTHARTKQKHHNLSKGRYQTMDTLQLTAKQSALILESDADGGISVNVAAGDIHSLPAALCQVIATKLMQDAAFQEELMDMLEVVE